MYAPDELCGSITAVFINCIRTALQRVKEDQRWWGKKEGVRGGGRGGGGGGWGGGGREWKKRQDKEEEVWIRSRGKQWAGSVKGNVGLLQVNVNIDLINTKLCWLSVTHTHIHSLYPWCPLSGINVSAVSCFGKVVILLRGEITMDSQIHFLLSIIQMWPSLIMHANVLSSLNQAEAE